jgi:hypothetical protein
MLNAFKSKTIWIGLVLALLSAANVYFEASLQPEVYSLIGGFFAAAIAWVRTQTTTPLSEK